MTQLTHHYTRSILAHISIINNCYSNVGYPQGLVCLCVFMQQLRADLSTMRAYVSYTCRLICNTCDRPHHRTPLYNACVGGMIHDSSSHQTYPLLLYIIITQNISFKNLLTVRFSTDTNFYHWNIIWWYYCFVNRFFILR